MNQRKGVLDTMRKEDKQTQLLIGEMYQYYKMYDLDFGAVHSKVFYELYISDEKSSFEIICQTVGIGMTTLKSYRKRYDALAVKLLKRGQTI